MIVPRLQVPLSVLCPAALARGRCKPLSSFARELPAWCPAGLSEGGGKLGAGRSTCSACCGSCQRHPAAADPPRSNPDGRLQFGAHGTLLATTPRGHQSSLGIRGRDPQTPQTREIFPVPPPLFVSPAPESELLLTGTTSVILSLSFSSFSSLVLVGRAWISKMIC